MTGFEVDTSGWEELLHIEGRLGDIVRHEMAESMEQSLITFEQAVKLETPVNFGTARASIAREMYGTPVDLTGMVTIGVPYGYYVENGRAAGRMPPVEAIELWVIRKGFQWTTKSGGKTRPMTSRQMAFVIARSIGERGTKGAHMFKKGYKLALPEVEKYWADLPNRVAARYNE